jgi:NAD(P)-dependent dehydrogenase (short-subunit alcohol dehydrogenase family)
MQSKKQPESDKPNLAVVTGGNRGIGLEICRQLARRGVRVLLTSRDASQGNPAAGQLRQEGLDVEHHALDVTDPATIQALRGHLEERYGRLDILVNNAAVHIDNHSRLVEVEPQVLYPTMETNAWGPLWLVQAMLPLLERSEAGRIVNVSSGAGQLAGLMGHRTPTYSLSKAMLNLLTRMLADELQGSGILVNAMCPGWVRTEMGGPGAPRSVEQGADTAVWLALLPEDGPQGGFFRDRKPIDW